MAKSQDAAQKEKRKKAISRYAKRHREIREFIGLSLDEESKRTGVAVSTISEMENELRDPHYSTADILIEYGLRIAAEKFIQYGVPPEELGIQKLKK